MQAFVQFRTSEAAAAAVQSPVAVLGLPDVRCDYALYDPKTITAGPSRPPNRAHAGSGGAGGDRSSYNSDGSSPSHYPGRHRPYGSVPPPDLDFSPPPPPPPPGPDVAVVQAALIKAEARLADLTQVREYHTMWLPHSVMCVRLTVLGDTFFFFVAVRNKPPLPNKLNIKNN